MNEELVNHLIELRKRLIFILIGFVLAFLLMFHFSNGLYTLLAQPLLTYLPHGTQLIATDVTSPFFVPLKLAAIVAVMVSLPNTVYQAWQFIAPGLYRHEKKLLVMTICCVIILFSIGTVFCYFIVLPTLFNFIGHIKATDITMMTDIGKYLDLVLSLFLVFGLAFQTPVIVFLLIRFNIISHKKMASLRKYILVGAFVVAAIVTPPDILSQTMLAVPLYLLYEMGMLLARVTKPGQKEK